MTPFAPGCPKCQSPLPESLLESPELRPCPSCQTPSQVEVFPALFRSISVGTSGETSLIEGEATCFYHPNRQAVRLCDGCGRFMCGLCDCEVREEHYCPACLETGRTKGTIKHLENRRPLYDNMALSLAVLPMIIFYLTFITAPMALYFAIRYWNAPRSIVRPSRVRFVFAIAIALLQIAGWGLGIFLLLTAT